MLQNTISYMFLDSTPGLLGLIIAIEVDPNSNKNADYRGKNTNKGDTGKFVDNLDSEEDNQSHAKQQRRSVNLGEIV